MKGHQGWRHAEMLREATCEDGTGAPARIRSCDLRIRKPRPGDLDDRRRPPTPDLPWIDRYHDERPHWALGYLTPSEYGEKSAS
jgi:transposase InsO family protein